MDKVYKAEISKLSEYVKQICERFQVRDEDPTTAEAELPTLHNLQLLTYSELRSQVESRPLTADSYVSFPLSHLRTFNIHTQAMLA